MPTRHTHRFIAIPSIYETAASRPVQFLPGNDRLVLDPPLARQRERAIIQIEIHFLPGQPFRPADARYLTPYRAFPPSLGQAPLQQDACPTEQAQRTISTMRLPPSCPVCEAPRARHFLLIDSRDYWRCEACQATFLDPAQLPDRSVEQDEYRLHRNDVSDPGYRAFLFRLATPLLARLPPGLSGLDYGCGPGPALAAMLSEAGHRMSVYDPLFRNDPRTLEQRYDFITCTEVAEHFHHPAKEFARLDQLLRPSGTLALMTTFQTDDEAFANWHYRRHASHVVFYREETFHAIAARHGWRGEIPGPNVAFLKKAAERPSTSGSCV